MWVFRPLPFGWSSSPLLCERFLAHLTRKVGLGVAGAVMRLMHYLDDFLVFRNSEKANPQIFLGVVNMVALGGTWVHYDATMCLPCLVCSILPILQG